MLEINIQEKKFSSSHSPILANCQFAMNQGELTAIIGPSGAGKSTLLRLIAGLDHQFTGNIELDGRALASEPIGIIFQKDLLMPWLSILDNICLVLGKSTAENIAKATQILTDVGLSNNLHYFPHQLSGGMQRRVALARAFVIHPKLLLMDEPFVSLDEPNVLILHALLKKLRQQYASTTIFVTHHLLEAITLADRIVFMSQRPGRVIETRRIDLPLNRTLHDPAVAAMHDAILREFPHILNGQLS